MLFNEENIKYFFWGGFLLRKKQAFRTSPTNRGSSVVKTSFLLPKFCKQNLLRYAPGLPSVGAPILATTNSSIKASLTNLSKQSAER